MLRNKSSSPTHCPLMSSCDWDNNYDSLDSSGRILRWRVKEKFFQPYQIWYLKATEKFEFGEHNNIIINFLFGINKNFKSIETCKTRYKETIRRLKRINKNSHLNPRLVWRKFMLLCTIIPHYEFDTWLDANSHKEIGRA